jgi:small conductance mechanosensitive channel
MDVVTTPHELGAIASVVWAWAVEFLPRLGSAIVLLIAGIIGAKWAARGIVGLTGRTERIDPTLRPVLSAIIRYAILTVVIVAALAQLGVQTASMLAAIGAAGLAIGLALQGTLANIAAGMMLLWLRPFNVGEFIETPDVAGSVVEIGLFATQLRTWDGIFKFVPNSQLWNVTLTNYARNPNRLVVISFGIDYGSDIAEARRILEDTARTHPDVLVEPAEPIAVPLDLGDSAVVLQLRAWSTVAAFWNTRWDLTQTGKQNLEAAGITIPFPQRVVHIADAGKAAAPSDAARLPAAEA